MATSQLSARQPRPTRARQRRLAAPSPSPAPGSGCATRARLSRCPARTEAERGLRAGTVRRLAAAWAIPAFLLGVLTATAVEADTAPPPFSSDAGTIDGSVVLIESAHGERPRLRADFAPFETLLVVFMDTWLDSLADLLALVPSTVEPILLVDEEESRRVEPWLRASGLDPSLVTLEVTDVDSPWVRDYAPLQLLDADASIRWVDTAYHPDRPLADAVPALLLGRFSVRLERVELRLDGGALISDGHGVCATTREALVDAGLDRGSAARRNQLFGRLGCDVLVLLPALSDEPTRHADVIAQFLDERTVAVGEMSPGSDPVDAERLDTAASLLRRGARTLGRDLDVVRVPIERGEGDIYYSWINGLRMGDVFAMPHFESSTPEIEERAYRALAEAMPDVTLAPVPADAMIRMDGAIHCITAQLNGRSIARLVRASRAPRPGARSRRLGGGAVAR